MHVYLVKEGVQNDSLVRTHYSVSWEIGDCRVRAGWALCSYDKLGWNALWLPCLVYVHYDSSVTFGGVHYDGSVVPGWVHYDGCHTCKASSTYVPRIALFVTLLPICVCLIADAALLAIGDKPRWTCFLPSRTPDDACSANGCAANRTGADWRWYLFHTFFICLSPIIKILSVKV